MSGEANITRYSRRIVFTMSRCTNKSGFLSCLAADVLVLVLPPYPVGSKSWGTRGRGGTFVL